MDLPALLSGLPDEPRVVVTGNHATPWTLLGLVDESLASYRLWVLNAQRGVPDRDGVTYETPFVGPGMRRSPRLRYTPSRLSLVPRLFTTTQPPDLVLLHTTRPRDGRVSLGTEVNVLPAAVEAARARGGRVVAQVSDRVPWTYGDAELDLASIDVLVEAEEPAVAGPSGAGGIDAEAAAIAALRGLTGRRGLRVWTEMFSDSVLALEQAGALDRDVPVQASFLFGSPELLAWVDRNPRVQMIRTETANDPGLIARNPGMTSINTALQVDLFGQANASRIHARIHSGFGGQTDFIVGALHSRGGQALMALRSWHPKADCSTIVPMVDEPVTSFQVTAVLTEQGAAELAGQDERTQARHLIEHAAHPRVREELWEEAVALGLA